MSFIAFSVKITGRVQGVAFRNWTQSRARSLGLAGWVQNDPTGSVSAFVQGPKTDVETLLNDLWSGPAAASVRDVQSSKATPDDSLTGFSILR